MPSLDTDSGTLLLWYEYDKVLAQSVLAGRYDAFVLPALCAAMHAGADLCVDGVVSSRLAHNLTYYATIMSQFYEAFRRPQLFCQNTVDDRWERKAPGVGLGFSCGIDSFCSLYDNYVNGVPPGYEVTHLFLTNVGAHGSGAYGRRWFERKVVRTKPIAEKLGLPLVVVDSNIADVIDAKFVYTHAARTIGAVLLLQGLWSRYYIASTNSYRDFGADGSTPIADHLLATDLTSIVHDGAQYSRIEKSQRICDWELTHHHLDVCMTDNVGFVNCARCLKCARAMITFDMLDVRDKYIRVFDWTKFSATRAEYIKRMKILGTDAPNYYWREIVEHAERIGYKL